MTTRARAVADVMEHITDEQLTEIISGLVNVPSPTGYEAMVARSIVDRLREHGVRAEYQEIDQDQANAAGVVAGDGGPSLLLYAPLDTFTTGDETYDVPGAADPLRPDMRAEATVHGPLVRGLGASNPKGHAATILAVAEAFAASGVRPAGDLAVGFGAGGMPSFVLTQRPGSRQNTGHGVGAGFLLERGYTTDYAIIAKPGWTVSHEEVGLVWIDVVVEGIHTYVGSRHRLPYDNAVVSAAAVAVHLEEWFEDYAARHEYETMRPQGIVSSVHGGLDRLAASTPASVRLRLDVRLTTRQTPAEVTREIRAELAEFARNHGSTVTVRQVAAIPASRTDPLSPVVRAVAGAFEEVTGEPHPRITRNSGATDANILRMRGVPTARVGMPKVLSAPDGGDVDFSLGMNLVDVREMRRLAEVLVRSVLLLPDHFRGGRDR